MKKSLLCFLFAFVIKSNAQITFEQDYDSASVLQTCTGTYGQLLMVKLEASGERFVKIDRCGKKMKLYNVNHSHAKTIDLSHLPVIASQGGHLGQFLYVSEKLFNTDNKLEYMYILSGSTYSTVIYNEDGTLLFSEPGFPGVIVNVHQLQHPIYNTAQGTKLILSYLDGKAKVFGLGGTLSTAIIKANEGLIEGQELFLSNARPNPASQEINIEYTLPEGSSRGEIVFFDLQGRELERYEIDNKSNQVRIPTNEYSAGSYFYELRTAEQKSPAKKMLIIR